MIETRVFNVDPVLGITEYFHYDHDTGVVRLEAQQEVGTLLEACKASYNQFDERSPWKDWNHVGSIPMTVLSALRQRYPDRREMERHALKWLEDNNKFRTRPGRLAVSR